MMKMYKETKRDMQKMIKARSNGVFKNYSKINIVEVKSLGYLSRGRTDTCTTIEYDGETYKQMAIYRGEYSAVQDFTTEKQ